MKPDLPVFDAELEQVIAQTERTEELMNRAGGLLKRQEITARQLARQMEMTSDAMHDCCVGWSNFPRLPLEATRREQLEQGIVNSLPRIFEQRTPATHPDMPPVPDEFSAHNYSIQN